MEPNKEEAEQAQDPAVNTMEVGGTEVTSAVKPLANSTISTNNNKVGPIEEVHKKPNDILEDAQADELNDTTVVKMNLLSSDAAGATSKPDQGGETGTFLPPIHGNNTVEGRASIESRACGGHHSQADHQHPHTQLHMN